MATQTKSTSTGSRSTAAKRPQDRRRSSTAAINVTAKKRGTIPVKLVGKEYTATPPKALISMEFAEKAQEAGEDVKALTSALWEWLDVTFGEAQSSEIQNRLRDPKDAIDFEHVMELMKLITEQATPNPTT